MSPRFLSCLFLLLLASVRAINLRFPFGSQPVRGVNLGAYDLVAWPLLAAHLLSADGEFKVVGWFSRYSAHPATKADTSPCSSS